MTLRQGDRLAYPVVQQHSIGQTGQEVVLGRVGHLERHRLGHTHIAENNYRSDNRSFPVVDRGDGVLDRNFNSVTLDQETVQWQMHGAVFSNCELRGICNGCAARSVDDSENFGHGPAFRFFVRPVRHSFCNEIEVGDIPRNVRTNNGVADGIERDQGAFFFQE